MIKKNIILTILPFILLLFPILSFTKLKPGFQLWYSGFTPNIAGQGYAGVASKNSAYNSLINPANIATISNLRIFSSGNISLPEWGGIFGISAPIAAGGNLYLATQFLSYDSTSLTRIGYGKKVRSDLAFGIEGILTINNSSTIQIGGGVSFGILWLPTYLNSKKLGWGFFDFSLGSKLKMVFYPVGGISLNPSPEFILQTGIEATFMKYKNAQWKFLSDFAIGIVPLPTRGSVHLQTWLSLGTTWTFWDIWDISTGVILGNFGLGFGNNKLLPYTFGTALRHKWDDFSFKIFYAFGGQKFYNKVEYLHNIGIELGFGGSKSQESIIHLSIGEDNINIFSPNNDLIQDTITLYPYISGISNINTWRLIIQDNKDKIIRTFEKGIEPINNKYTIKTFFKAYFLPNNKDTIPKQIIWDGKNQKSQNIPDGKYQASLQIRYNEDELKISPIKTIILDNTPPYALVQVSNKYLYLGDYPSNQLVFIQKLSSDPWTAKLIDQSSNNEISSWVWSSNQNYITNIWKLKNPDRITIPSGKYIYSISSYDKAGNFYITNISNINIITEKRKFNIKSDHLSFSPNNDTYLDNIDISINYSSIIGLKKSYFSIYTESGNKIYSQELSIDNFPSNIVWSGKDKQNKNINDGEYLVVLENYFDDKIRIDSNPLMITIDITPPNFNAEFTPKRFSPDNDKINDKLKINISSEDPNEVQEWILTIKNTNQQVLQSFTNNQANGILLWDINNKKIVNSSEELIFEIKISDKLGNTLNTPIHSIRVDVLTDSHDKNLILNPITAYFEEGRGVLSGNIFPYLEQLWEYIKHYPNDKIKIISQASFLEAQNSEYEAYRLGILRGDSIKEYLINKGLNQKNILIEVKISDNKNQTKQKELRKVKVYIEKDLLKENK